METLTEYGWTIDENTREAMVIDDRWDCISCPKFALMYAHKLHLVEVMWLCEQTVPTIAMLAFRVTNEYEYDGNNNLGSKRRTVCASDIKWTEHVAAAHPYLSWHRGWHRAHWLIASSNYAIKTGFKQIVVGYDDAGADYLAGRVHLLDLTNPYFIGRWWDAVDYEKYLGYDGYDQRLFHPWFHYPFNVFVFDNRWDMIRCDTFMQRMASEFTKEEYEQIWAMLDADGDIRESTIGPSVLGAYDTVESWQDFWSDNETILKSDFRYKHIIYRSFQTINTFEFTEEGAKLIVRWLKAILGLQKGEVEEKDFPWGPGFQ